MAFSKNLHSFNPHLTKTNKLRVSYRLTIPINITQAKVVFFKYIKMFKHLL